MTSDDRPAGSMRRSVSQSKQSPGVKTERGEVAPCLTGKVGYHAKEDALLDLRDQQAKAAAGVMRYAPVRAYWCRSCRFWHLSSQPELLASDVAGGRSMSL